LKTAGKTIFLMLAITALAWGAPQGKGKGKGKGNSTAQGNSVVVYTIPQPDVVIVRDYYRGTSLPPGLAKKLARGGSLPPGWQKKIRPVPVVIEQRLAPLPQGYVRGIYDGAYVVYDSQRGLIVDLFLSF
jgi:hypothetical protein